MQFPEMSIYGDPVIPAEPSSWQKESCTFTFKKLVSSAAAAAVASQEDANDGAKERDHRQPNQPGQLTYLRSIDFIIIIFEKRRH